MTNGHLEVKLENGHSPVLNGYRKSGYVNGVKSPPPHVPKDIPEISVSII